MILLQVLARDKDQQHTNKFFSHCESLFFQASLPASALNYTSGFKQSDQGLHLEPSHRWWILREAPLDSLLNQTE